MVDLGGERRYSAVTPARITTISPTSREASYPTSGDDQGASEAG